MSKSAIIYYRVSNTVVGCQEGSHEQALRERQGARRVADADGNPLAAEKSAKETKKAAPRKKQRRLPLRRLLRSPRKKARGTLSASPRAG